MADVYKHPITAVHDNGASHSKPLDWIRLLIGNCTHGDIYDPFLGSGITLQACDQLGRKCFGIEIDPGSAAIALQLAADIGLEPQLC